MMITSSRALSKKLVPSFKLRMLDVETQRVSLMPSLMVNVHSLLKNPEMRMTRNLATNWRMRRWSRL